MVHLARKACLQCALKRILIQARGLATAASGNPKRKAKTRMKAWQIHQYGGKEDLTFSESARVPQLRNPKDILVEIHAASINPIDVRMLEGYGRNMINQLRQTLGSMRSSSEFPLTLGRDFSGVVVETGQGVARFKPGDEVWGALGAQRQGTHALFTVTGEREISLKPKSLSHEEAASIPYVATTNWNALCDVGELTEKNTFGKRILIHGGSGGIGTFAIQLLKSWGATVVTTCSTDAIPLVESIGADDIIDYRTQDVKQELMAREKMDLILDPIGGDVENQSKDALKTWSNAKYVSLVAPILPDTDKYGIPGGIIQSATSLGGNVLKGFSKGRSYRWGLFIPNGTALSKVANMVDSGQIRPIIDKVYKFDEVPEAFEKVGAVHGRGKSVIKMI